MLLTEQTARELLSGLPGEIGLYVQDTATGETIALNAAQPIEAASVIKLYVMTEAFRQAEAGLLDLDMPITVPPEKKLPSCGALTYLHDGVTLPVRDLITLMIILSDNTATNLLIDLLGQESIQQTIDALGMPGTRLRRKLFMPELARQGIINEVTAADCAKLLSAMLQGTLVSTEASRQMLDILRNQRLKGKMPFHLSSRGIKTAHKTGEDDGITHDVGVIFAATPRIFCFVSQHTLVPMAERTLQDLAALAADIPLNGGVQHG